MVIKEETQQGAIGPNVEKSIYSWLLLSCLDSAQLLDPPQLQMA